MTSMLIVSIMLRGLAFVGALVLLWRRRAWWSAVLSVVLGLLVLVPLLSGRFFGGADVSLWLGGVEVALSVAVLGFVLVLTSREVGRALQASEAKFATAFRQSPDAIVITTLPDGVIVEVNPGFETISGWPAQEAVGRSTRDLGIWAQIDQRAAFLDRIARHGSVNNFTCAVRTRTGAVVPTLISAERIELDGKPHLLSVVRDITELQQAQEAIRQAQEALIEQQTHERQRVEQELARLEARLIRQTRLATIGQVSASIAHELRNPLGTVRNAVYYLKRQVPDAQPAWGDYLAMIDQEVSAANRIITDLLEMSHAKVPVKEDLELPRIVQDAFERVPGREAVTLHLDIAEAATSVRADPVQLVQVFVNLFANAVQAMEGHGAVTVRAERVGDVHRLTVRDTGPGIPAGLQAEVFEPLFTTRAKGTGLGLAVCRQIIAQHGGTLDLDPTVEDGAAFEFQLPVADTLAVEAAPDATNVSNA